ncbi:FecR domain-containing protein [Variovorax sp.]|jgi:transmembrane sensor|uniref:FecR domain-containing protein n=1 Tax=Variovorax sp. TaxID=1871043 RepID=UPI003BAB6D6C
MSSASPLSPADDGRALPQEVVAQAIQWFVQLSSGVQGAGDQAAFDAWHRAHADHARAWQRLQGMHAPLQAAQARVAPALARAALRQAATVSSRRRALKTLAWAGAGGGAVLLAQRQWSDGGPLAGALADARTAVGERRQLRLPDGTQLLLNTATSVDIRFDVRERRLLLHAGEIQVSTARDGQGRPFVVATRDGTLVPVGTRFVVRRIASDGVEDGTLLSVSEGAVQVRTALQAAGQAPTLVPAGRQLRFTREGIGAPATLDESASSWTAGMLTAEGMRLADFVAELDRYRPGRLRCAPEVAQLRITGSWPLDGDAPTERVLASLERQLPVRVSRLTRYWVTVGPR